MGMFEKYDSLCSDYIPDNTSPKTNTVYKELNENPPRVTYDINNKFIGYSWNQGDTFELKLSLDKTIKINGDSIVYKDRWEYPTTCTKAKCLGQKAYNLSTCQSWTFVGEYDGDYLWIEDDNIIYPSDGDMEVTFSEDMFGKTIIVTVFNFRWEPIHSFCADNSNSINCNFDFSVTDKFNKGIYNCIVKVCDSESSTVRDKFVLIVT